MKLTYRGQTYTRSQTIATVDPHTILTYRGQSYQRRHYPLLLSCSTNLIYRGVSYLTSQYCEGFGKYNCGFREGRGQEVIKSSNL